MKVSSDNLKKILVGEGYLNEHDFVDAEQAAKDLGRKLEDILIFRGFINEENLSKLLAQHLKVKFVNIGKLIIAPDVLKLIPEKLARNYHMVPFEAKDGVLSVAMEDPSDFEALEYAKRQTGMQIVPHYASSSDINKAQGQYNRNIREEFDNVIAENIKKASPEGDPVKAAEELPIIKVLDTIIMYAVSERASDVHIEVQEKDVVIRFRVDGVLRDIARLPRGIEIAIVARIKILSNLKIDEHRVPQDGRYKLNVDEEVIALRISIIPGFYGENVVMRVLHESARPLSLEELGVTGKNLELLRKNSFKPHGMILVTGPTGSGKTTTLYSVLNSFNAVKVKICTIEDPIEYGISRVSQIQVHPKVGLTFAAGLRSLLRHDPDIIMVGEIRDKETAEIAVHSALTGHLVLSTLHTNNAVGAIPRLLDMGVEDYLISSTINVILAQRLVRRICNSCIVPYKPTQVILDRFKKEYGADLTNHKFYKGKGCNKCNMSGYSGRVGIYECLEVTDTIRESIAKKVSADQLSEQAVNEGMITMLLDGINKVQAGQTTIEEVLRVVRED
ncbi:GspE/PulE family protein [Patescibacteria group bacterium]